MRIEEMIKDWQLNLGASVGSIRQAESDLGCTLPLDYVEFLIRHDGGEGFVGDNYLIVWRAEELARFNREYEVGEYAPGVILFGSDGGGEGYGFDLRDKIMPVVRIPFVGMELRYAKPVAVNFSTLLTLLAE
jgi:hypothetical protein